MSHERSASIDRVNARGGLSRGVEKILWMPLETKIGFDNLFGAT
jgi:hypothetical protein